MGQKLGDVENPLLVSVRSGAKFSMPGMMDTILNLGLNDKTVKALEAKSGNPRFAYDCYRRFIQMYGNVVLEVSKHDFDEVFDAQKKKAKVKLDTGLTAEDLQQVIAGYKKLVEKKTGKPFPQEAMEQLAGARDAVFRSWFNDRAKHYRKMNQIPDDLGTAVNVQAMVFGNMGETSATGVGFTRNPATGEKKFYGEFLENAQGEDVVSGVRTPHPISELETWNAAVYNQLREITTMLEKHYRDMQDFEFTIQDGKLYMLQTRNGKRTGPAAVRIAVDMVEEGLINKQEAILRVEPQQLDQLLHPVLDPASKKSLAKLAVGLPASPGAAVGTIVFTANEAVEASKKAPVILVRKETVPDDIHGMEVAKGILTSRGGMTSHAAVVCRGMGTPCVAGAEAFTVSEQKKEVTVTVGGKNLTLKEGDWLSLDGSTGEVFAGQSQHAGCRPLVRLPGLLHGLGRRVPRQVRRARQRGYPARRQGGPQVRSRGHRPVPHRAHVLRRGPHRAHAGHDSGPRREDPPQGPAEAPAHAAQGFRRPVRSHGRLPGGHPHARSAAARVPAQARRPDGGCRHPALRRYQEEARAGGHLPEVRRGSEESEDRAGRAAEARGRAARVQPHAGTPRLPSGHHLSRRSPRCRRAPSSKPPCRWPRRARR